MREPKTNNMEFLVQFNVSFILLALAFVSLLFNTFIKSRNVQQIKKLPPGPRKLPLIGNMHQLVGGRLPHHIFRDIASKHGPIFHLRLGEIPLVVVSSARLAKEVLKTKDPIFAGRPQLLSLKFMFYDYEDVLGHTYDDYWRQLRKIWAQDLLSTKTVRSLAPVRLDEGDRLISLARNKAVAGEIFNLSESICQYTMSVFCRASFGKVFKGLDEFIMLIHEVASLSTGFDLADLFPSFKILRFLSRTIPKMKKVHRKINAFLDGIINEHIRNFDSKRNCNGEGDEDLIDSLLRVKDTTNLNIKAIIFDVIVGGNESSTALTVWTMLELMKNPRVMEKVQGEIREAFLETKFIDEARISELKYLNLVIKEAFRLHPPAPMLFPRASLEDCVIVEYNIPAKTMLMVNVWAIGRDPELWSDPESFIPERYENSMIDFTGNNYELIPFGAGKRICPGMTLGLANTKLPLALLLHDFNWNLPKGVILEDLDMTETDGIIARRKVDLCLVPTLWSTAIDCP